MGQKPVWGINRSTLIVLNLTQHKVTYAEFGPDVRLILTKLVDGSVMYWNAQIEKPQHIFATANTSYDYEAWIAESHFIPYFTGEPCKHYQIHCSIINI